MLRKKAKLVMKIILQVGSIFCIRTGIGDDQGGDGDSKGRGIAELVKIGGVPALNRSLVQYNGETNDTSVNLGDMIKLVIAEVEN